MVLYITKNLEILIIIVLRLTLAEPKGQNATTTETFLNTTVTYTIGDNSYDEYKYSEFSHNMEKIEILCWKIFAPIFLVVGVVGNTLSILVLRR